jgi:hypothetical protein
MQKTARHGMVMDAATHAKTRSILFIEHRKREWNRKGQQHDQPSMASVFHPLLVRE